MVPKFLKEIYLWFVHADSVLQKDVIQKILDCPTPVGCLKIRFYPNSIKMRMNALVSNMRASITNLAFGDQAIFIKREVFEENWWIQRYAFNGGL